MVAVSDNLAVQTVTSSVGAVTAGCEEPEFVLVPVLAAKTGYMPPILAMLESNKDW